MKKRKNYIAVIMTALLVLSCAGCKAYKEHSDKYSAAKGDWVLDCIYVDTKPISFVSGSLTLTSDKTGTLIITKEEIPNVAVTTEAEATPNADDENTANANTTPAPEQVTETISFTDGKNGEITGTDSANGSLTYDFNVDTEADILHMYVMIGTSQYHYIFIKANAQ